MTDNLLTDQEKYNQLNNKMNLLKEQHKTAMAICQNIALQIEAQRIMIDRFWSSRKEKKRNKKKDRPTSSIIQIN